MSRSLIDSTTGPTYQFIALNGEIQGMGQTLEEITRARVDGQAYRRFGIRGTPFDMIGTVDCVNAADAVVQYQAIKALQGTTVTVWDDHGSRATDVVVLDVTKVGTKPIRGAVGGTLTNPTYLLTLRLQLVVAHPDGD